MSEWCPFIARRPGPAWKVGYSYPGEVGPKRGEVDHSAEGYWSGLYSALDGPKFKSWQFTVGLDRTEQHYPFRAHCWHAGDVDDDGAVAANLDLVGIEYLGLVGQPLTPYQIDMGVRITQWCAEQEGRSTFRRFDGWDPDEPGLWLLAEHNEVSDVPTACPSNRIPWGIIIPALEEDEDMKPYLARHEDSGFIWIVWGNSKTYLQQMAHADALGISREVVVLPPGTLDSLGRVGG